MKEQNTELDPINPISTRLNMTVMLCLLKTYERRRGWQFTLYYISVYLRVIIYLSYTLYYLYIHIRTFYTRDTYCLLL